MTPPPPVFATITFIINYSYALSLNVSYTFLNGIYNRAFPSTQISHRGADLFHLISLQIIVSLFHDLDIFFVIKIESYIEI